MTTSTTVYLVGPVKWAKVFEGNRSMGTEKYPVAEGGQYEISVGLLKEDTDYIKGLNRLYEGKVYKKLDKNYLPGDHKLTYFTFKRKHDHRKKSGATIIEWSGPPSVVDSEGDDWDCGLIGNGSVCTVRLMVTESNGRNFVRLEAIRVEDHIEYVNEDGETTDYAEDNRTKGLPF